MTSVRSGKDQAKALAGSRRWTEARQVLQQVCSAQPQDAEAHYLLGAVYAELGMIDQAIANYLEAVRLKPNYADVYNNLGALLETRGNLPDAIEAYRQAAGTDPNNLPAHYNLGRLLIGQKRAADAITVLQRAAEIARDNLQVLRDLAYAMKLQGDLIGADAILQRALKLKPDDAPLHNQLGNVQQLQGAHTLAVASYERALELDPRFSGAWGNLGGVLCMQGRMTEAERCFRAALTLQPQWTGAHSSLVLIMNYTCTDGARIFAEHVEWSNRHAVSQTFAHDRSRADRQKKLRVGYVSPDFKSYSVSFFIEAILASHDRGAFEVFCYSDVGEPDVVTERLRGLCDCWRDICELSDAAMARLVATDEVDILVDLAGHSSKSRLRAFAEKPSPVQVTYLGYPNTSGLRAMDYRITDAWADPAGAECFHTESLTRLPNGFLCYAPYFDAPPVAPAPVLRNGYITFGTFNVSQKVTEQVVAVWAGILQGMPGSQLLMKNRGFNDPPTRERYVALFAAQGVARDRLEFEAYTVTLREHLALYGRVDIALDTFPYNGTTTTCEALWMGVPVVTLRGNLHAGRVGVSLLNQVGLPQLVAANTEEYVRLAVELAADTGKLAELRTGLREQVARSPLCDTAGFMRGLEGAYRQMWLDWCSSNDSIVDTGNSPGCVEVPIDVRKIT